MIASSSIATYKIDAVNVLVSLKQPKNQLIPLGGGSSPLTVPAKQSTNFSIPLTLSLSSNSTDTSPALQFMLQTCAVPGAQIPLHYTVNIDAFVVLKRYQVYEGDYSIACPPIAASASQLLNQAIGNSGVTQALGGSGVKL